MFYRTIRMVENGIKPVYVFDGKAPEMKSGELEKRHERRAEVLYLISYIHFVLGRKGSRRSSGSR
jgi:5'-3' exonuclease